MELSAFDLSGKVALVTGGAHGIGFSIAEGMARCGATVCFNCSSERSLEKGVEAYKAAGIDAHGYVADVTDWDAVSAMVEKIKAEVGPVDILVNNAGIIQAPWWKRSRQKSARWTSWSTTPASSSASPCWRPAARTLSG